MTNWLGSWWRGSPESTPSPAEPPESPSPSPLSSPPGSPAVRDVTTPVFEQHGQVTTPEEELAGRISPLPSSSSPSSSSSSSSSSPGISPSPSPPLAAFQKCVIRDDPLFIPVVFGGIRTEVFKAFPESGADLVPGTEEKVTDYACTRIEATGTIPIATRETWRYQRLDLSWVDLRTRPMPDDLLEYYHLESGMIDIITEGGVGSQRDKCAEQIERVLQELAQDPAKAHLLQEPHFSRVMSTILDTLWSKSTVEWAMGQAQAQIADTSSSPGVRLAIRPTGLIEVDIEIPGEHSIEITYNVRMQLEAVQTINGQEVTRPLPYFSTTKMIASVDAEQKCSESEEVEQISVRCGAFEHAPAVEEKAPAGILAGVGQGVGGLFAFKEHRLKRGKYELSLAQCARTLQVGDHPLGDQVVDKIKVADVESGIKKMRAILASPMDVRQQYPQFLDALRATLQTDDYKEMMARVKADPNNYPEGLRLIHDVVKARFCGNEMYGYCRSLVYSCIDVQPEEMLPEIAWDDQFRRIDNMPVDLGANRLAVSVGKAKGSANVWFDPHKETNVPHANYRFTMGGKERLNLRFGSPTWVGLIYAESANPEFCAFLDALSATGGKHLYINFQDRNPRWFGNESGRCRALEGLAPQYPDTFYIATLPQDSAFYNQTGPFLGLSDAVGFRRQFMSQMLEEPKSGFHFSQNLHIQENRELLSNVLDEVHRHVFDGKETLTVQERQDFIEIAYVLITLKLLQLSGADSFNMSCKDAIDRGGKSMALLLNVLGIFTDQAEEPDFQEQLMVSTHAPALIVKKQAIIPSRRSRFIQAMERLEGRIDELQPLNERYGVSRPEVCRGGEQPQPLTSSSSEGEEPVTASSVPVDEPVWLSQPLPTPPKTPWSADEVEEEEWEEEPAVSEPRDVSSSGSAASSEQLNKDYVNALRDRFIYVCNSRNKKSAFTTSQLTPATGVGGQPIPDSYVVDKKFVELVGKEIFKASLQLDNFMRGGVARRSKMAPGVTDVFQALLARVNDPHAEPLIFSTSGLKPVEDINGNVIGVVVDEALVRNLGNEVLGLSYDTAVAYNQAKQILSMGSRGLSQYRAPKR